MWNVYLTDIILPSSDQKNCTGHPRNKLWDGDWISESSNYVWDLNNASNTNGLTCRGVQGSPTYPANVPMTTARPGDSLRMRFWGNGHSRWDIGSPLHRDPGLVRVYWAGQKEVELTHKDNLTEANWFPGAQANFSGDAITLVTNGKMNEKANYMTLTLPQNIENGRHMMVWVWAWAQGLGTNDGSSAYDNTWANSYSTCFDIEVVDSDFDGKHYSSFSQNSMLMNYSGATFDNSDEGTPDSGNVCATGTGYKGGMTQYPCTGAECPPCWYKTATGINCFDYDSTGKCPFGGAYDCKLNKQLRRALKHERAPFV